MRTLIKSGLMPAVCAAILLASFLILAQSPKLPALKSVELLPKLSWDSPNKIGDVTLVLSDSGDGSWVAAVMTERKDVDTAIVTVLYKTQHPELGSLTLSETSVAPLVQGAYGGTERNFRIPKEAVTRIRIKLLKTAGEVEF
jgi:hypothetical protein